jgi:putative transposase
MADKKLTHARTAVYNVNYHFVWCVKYKREVLVGKIDKRLKEIFYEIAKDKGFAIKSMEIMPDHVHVYGILRTKKQNDDSNPQIVQISNLSNQGSDNEP